MASLCICEMCPKFRCFIIKSTSYFQSNSISMELLMKNGKSSIVDWTWSIVSKQWKISEFFVEFSPLNFNKTKSCFSKHTSTNTHTHTNVYMTQTIKLLQRNHLAVWFCLSGANSPSDLDANAKAHQPVDSLQTSEQEKYSARIYFTRDNYIYFW